MSLTEKVAIRLNEGRTDESVAKELGIHPAFVRTIRYRRNIKQTKPLKPQQLRAALALIEQAQSLAQAKEIAARALSEGKL